ncbi:trehalase-like domain-containing protein, partial [Rhizobium johnstonii]|uniref:trehalase-like domain-containing protein n=1 Tax=Rhizobium johnstonii TaxID=3019933 RepID=UPI003F992911
WLCFPRFDSPACFAALLCSEDNGFWSLSPSGENVRVTLRYRNDTLILETEFQTETGTAVLIDFLPSTMRMRSIVPSRSGMKS